MVDFLIKGGVVVDGTERPAEFHDRPLLCSGRASGAGAPVRTVIP